MAFKFDKEKMIENQDFFSRWLGPIKEKPQPEAKELTEKILTEGELKHLLNNDFLQNHTPCTSAMDLALTLGADSLEAILALPKDQVDQWTKINTQYDSFKALLADANAKKRQ